MILSVDQPGHRPKAAQLCPYIGPALLFLLVSQGDEREFSGGVDGRAGGVALSQVAQVLLACSGGHGAELVRLVSGVFGIDDLGQQEVPEHGGLGEGHTLWDRRAERWHIFWTSDRHTKRQKAHQEDTWHETGGKKKREEKNW